MRNAVASLCLILLPASAAAALLDEEHPSHDMSAADYELFVQQKLKHTYPLTAMRMLAECGGIREGICVDIGCGPGHLDVELAKMSHFKIIGLDINADMEPLFEKRMRAAGLDDRVSFVAGDAQKLPFPDDYADVIVSRGTLIFIPDIAKCLREVDRVLKPTGVAFLGGRYLYAPKKNKEAVTNEKLRQFVRDSGVAGAKVVESRGQWVKIVGSKAPEAARGFQGGSHMLAGRLLVDYGIVDGRCLILCRADGALEQGLQRGLLETTQLQVTALYPSEEVAQAARERIRQAGHDKRIACAVGDVHAIPCDANAFDLIAGAGPVLIWGDRQKAMREIYRVLRSGGAALVGGRYLHMPDSRKVASKILRQDAAKTGIATIRVIDDMGQWVEIRKPDGKR